MLSVYITLFFFACASHQTRQEKVVNDYIKNHPELNSQILDSLNKGFIVPGMSYEQVLVAGGIISSGHRNHSMNWPMLFSNHTPVQFFNARLLRHSHRVVASEA